LGQSVNVIQINIGIKMDFGFEVDSRSNYFFDSRRKRFKTLKFCDRPQKSSIKQE
jgi:hypothetical protein